MKKEDLCLIVMDNCKEFGLKVNEELKKLQKKEKDFIIPIKMSRFNDGEGKVEILDTLRDKDVYIISDTHNYSCTYKMYHYEHHMSPDEHFQDIKRVIIAMMGHAKRISVVMPMLYEARQHRRKGRESLDCAIALQELQNLGVHEIITFDVHDPNIQNAIPTTSFDNFYTMNSMVEVFLDQEEFDRENTLVISPDTGAMDRARFLADMLQVNTGVFYKRRDVSKIVNGHNPIVAHEYLGNDVSGKTIIIVDDMLASGGSAFDVVKELKNRNAGKIFFFMTFVLFTTGYKKFDEAYKNGDLAGIYSTNLTYVPDEIKEKPWFHMADCSSYLAKIIDRLNNGQSISKLMNDRSATKKQSKKVQSLS